MNSYQFNLFEPDQPKQVVEIELITFPSHHIFLTPLEFIPPNPLWSEVEYDILKSSCGQFFCCNVRNINSKVMNNTTRNIKDHSENVTFVSSTWSNSLNIFVSILLSIVRVNRRFFLEHNDTIVSPIEYIMFK